MPHTQSPEHALAVLLRRAVREHATVERRLHHVPILHLGVPGEAHEVFAVVPGEPLDHALRADIVAAMRHRHRQRHGTAAAGRRPALVWLTRSGDLDLQDIDAEWYAATRQAYAEAGAAVRFAVVNRRGWHVPTTGERREWARPRPQA